MARPVAGQRPPPKRLPPAERSLSNSERQSFTMCRRRYFWTYVKGYAPLSTPTPFLVGTAFHRTLELFYGGSDPDVDAVVKEVFGPAQRGEGGRFLSPEQLDDLQKQETMAIGMCGAYLKVRNDDRKKWRVLQVNGAPAIELKGKFRVNRKWEMFFTADLLVERLDRKGCKGPWIVEHKTTSSIDAGYVSRLSLDEQVSTYLYGARKAWNVPAEGVIYNVAMKPRIRQKQNEDRAEYLNRVLALYEDSPEEYLYRCELLRSDADLAEFGAELELFTGELERTASSGFYYKNTGACTNRGTCPFMPLCVNGEENAKDRFRVKSNPRDRYEEEE